MLSDEILKLNNTYRLFAYFLLQQFQTDSDADMHVQRSIKPQATYQ
jgi:hypothetical protein